MATFVKRLGRWQARVRRKGQKPLTKTFTLKLDAQRWAHKIEEQIAAGSYEDSREAGKWTLARLITWYKETVVPTRVAGTTDTFRLATLERLVGGYKTIATLTPMDFVAFAKARLKEGVSSDTVRRELDTASDMFTSAVAFKVLTLPANPVALARQILKKLRVFKPKVKRKRRFKAGEEDALMAVDRVDLRTIQDVVRFDLETTMRRRELALMRPEDRDRQFHTLRIWESKTDWKTGKEGRTIPLSPEAERILDRQPKRASGLVWGYKDPHSLTRAFQKLVKAANELHRKEPKKYPKITDLRLHDMRHEAITRLFEKGYTVEQVMVFSGHLDEDTVHDYTHMSPALIASNMRQKKGR